jgi:SAM-dependent methyltransferase
VSAERSLIGRLTGPRRPAGGAVAQPPPEQTEAAAGDFPDPHRYDTWLGHLFADRLEPIEAACAGAGPEAFALFRNLDDELWTVLLSREYTIYPNIRALLPDLPDRALQRRWNGWTGLKLLSEGKAFYTRALAVHARHSTAPLSEAKLLDFGCGWGRLTRFFARDVAPGALFACDPVEEILEVCERTRVPATLARCEHIPERLPFETSFDLVFAFSVFTHLSEPAHEACLQAIRRSLSPGGLLVVTLRPPAYLTACERMRPIVDSLGPDWLAELEQPRYLFVPHPAEPDHPQFHGAEMSYGETVISLPYIRERWAPYFEILDIGVLTEDMHQVVLALRRRS